MSVRALELGRAPEQFQLYDLSTAPAGEQAKYRHWVKQHSKLYKAMLLKYASITPNTWALNKPTFDDLKDQKNTMNLAEVFAFLGDFQINKLCKVRKDEVKRIITLINQGSQRCQMELDLDGFTEFVLQLGHFLHEDKTAPPSVFLPQLFKHFSKVSLKADKPLFQRLFEDLPHGSSELQ